MAHPATIDQAMAVLYGLPRESFVDARNEMVKAIRNDGNRDLATQVKTLRKPSAIAGIVNQVVRADPDGVNLILQAAELLRIAQDGALEGSPVSSSELQQQYRAAVGALAQTAPSNRAEVRQALEAATIDAASNEALRTGCLVVVPTPESIFGVAPNATGTSAAVVDELEERRAAKRAKTQQVAAAKAKQERAAAQEKKRLAKEKEQKRRELTKRLAAAARAEAQAVQDIASAALQADQAQREFAATQAQLAELEASLASLRATSDVQAKAVDDAAQAQSDSAAGLAMTQATIAQLTSELADLDRDT